MKTIDLVSGTYSTTNSSNGVMFALPVRVFSEQAVPLVQLGLVGRGVEADRPQVGHRVRGSDLVVLRRRLLLPPRWLL